MKYETQRLALALGILAALAFAVSSVARSIGTRGADGVSSETSARAALQAGIVQRQIEIAIAEKPAIEQALRAAIQDRFNAAVEVESTMQQYEHTSQTQRLSQLLLDVRQDRYYNMNEFEMSLIQRAGDLYKTGHAVEIGKSIPEAEEAKMRQGLELAQRREVIEQKYQTDVSNLIRASRLVDMKQDELNKARLQIEQKKDELYRLTLPVAPVGR